MDKRRGEYMHVASGMGRGNDSLLGIWLRKRAEKAFADYPKCETFSDMLRVLSAIATLVSLGFLVSVMSGRSGHW